MTTRVYPRPRGGTLDVQSYSDDTAGLSPPTRGNQVILELVENRLGSIPAHAGEPSGLVLAPLPLSVYPRPRGGTSRCLRGWRYWSGLSPPTRGNLVDLDPESRPVGSIPAHAGEPPISRSSLSPYGVYPRPRGGTTREVAMRLSRRGLSPPTRGNRPKPCVRRLPMRSIPAHAGEPCGTRPTHTDRAVYPRPRGGTLTSLRCQPRTPGLSPPTRGNRAASLPAPLFRRSIPAHAGEPRESRGRRAP